MASAYEMFVEKVATGIYVFLITAVVESFPPAYVPQEHIS